MSWVRVPLVTQKPWKNPRLFFYSLCRFYLCICKYASIVERNLEFCIFRMEIILQSIYVTTALPVAHGKVVEQVVATGFWCCCGHLCLCEYPLQALNGKLAHILNGVGASHDDIHTSETTHWAYIYNIVLNLRVSEPCGHQVFHAMNGSRSYSRFFVGLGDSQVKRCKSFVFTRHIDAGFQMCVIDGKTLYDFHILVLLMIILFLQFLPPLHLEP